MLIAAVNMIGALSFLMASMWGVFNYREEVSVTQYWLVYTLAALAGTAFLLTRTLEWSGVAPALMDAVQPIFGIIGITLITTNAIICYLSPVKRQIK